MSNARIKIKGLGSIVMKNGGQIDKDTDYIVALRVALSEIHSNVEDSSNPFKVFVCKYISTELVKRIGDKQEIKVERAKSKSQVARAIISEIARRKGLSEQEYYDKEMDNFIAEKDKELDDLKT